MHHIHTRVPLGGASHCLAQRSYIFCEMYIQHESGCWWASFSKSLILLKKTSLHQRRDCVHLTKIAGSSNRHDTVSIEITWLLDTDASSNLLNKLRSDIFENHKTYRSYLSRHRTSLEWSVPWLPANISQKKK